MMRRQSLLETPTQQLLSAAAGAVIVPHPSTPQGGRRRYVISMPLVTITEDPETPYIANEAAFSVDNPSTRLQLKVAVLYAPNQGSNFRLPQTGLGSIHLALQAYDRDQQGRILPSNQIISGLPVPTSYEAMTMNDRWRGVVTLPVLVDDVDIDPGFLLAVAAWEPLPGWNGDDLQLARIFDACHMYIETGLESPPGQGGT